MSVVIQTGVINYRVDEQDSWHPLIVKSGTDSSHVESEIGIMVVGNRTSYSEGATIGQYVILKDSSIAGLSDGIYKAIKTIQANTAIDGTYLTPVSNGGLNDLKMSIGSSHVGSEIGIMIVGNKTTYSEGVAIGQYAVLADSSISGLTDGLYKAIKPVPYNTEIDETYLAPVLNGGLNDFQMASTESEVAPKRMVCIADSYGTHSGTNWCTVLASMFNLSGSNFYYWAEGSSGFEHPGHSGHTFKTLLQAHLSDISKRSTITDVFVGGGTNDFYYKTSNLSNAMQETCDYIHTEFPNAKVHFIFMGYYTLMDNTQRNNYIDTIKLYQSMRYLKNINVINAYQLMHVGTFREDTQHPNVEGSKEIARIIYNKLYGDPYEICYRNSVNMTPASGFTITHTDWLFSVYGDQALITTPNMEATGNFTVSPGNIVKIGTFDSTLGQVVSTDARFDTTAAVINGSTVNSVPVSIFMQTSTNRDAVEVYMVTMPYSGSYTAGGFKINCVSNTVPLVLA